jgi:hypothetical protein
VLAFNATLPPLQKPVEPPAVMVAVGAAVTVTEIAPDVTPHPLLVTTTV